MRRSERERAGRRGPTAAVGMAFTSLRGLAKRAIIACFGPVGRLAAHKAYHRLLSRLGRFDPPEHPATLRLLADLAGISATILDVGANVGRYALFLARHRRPGTPLYCFEPNAEAAAVAAGNLAALPDVRIIIAALGDVDGRAKLVMPRDMSGNDVTGLGWIGSDPDHGVAVAIHRLDSLVAAGSLEVRAPVLVKIDVEGHEGPMLDGADGLLKRHRPILYLECEGGHLARMGRSEQRVLGHLSELGYVLHAERDGRFTPCRSLITGVSNYLAVPGPFATLPEPVRAVLRAHGIAEEIAT